MEPIRLSDVLRATGGDLLGPVEGNPWIPAVTTDSKDVAPGALFVPIRGKRFDGHVFVEQAFLGGAAFSLVSRDTDLARMPRNVIVVPDTKRALGDLARWQRSRFDVPVIGVTGSCGKTTVKEMLRQILGDGVVVSHASFNNDIGVPLTLLRMDRTTRAAVVEIGTNAPGEIAALTSIARPTVGVLTTIEEAHLEGLGTVRGVMREKSALLHGLTEGGAAIVNADNLYCREILESLDHGTAITYGTWEDATVFGVDAQPTDEGFSFWLFGKMPVEVPALGMHNVGNALAAISVALWLGLRPDAIVEALRGYRAPPMRMAREVVGDVTLINDAYNANPASMDAAIRELGLRRCTGRRIAVIGDMLELGDNAERLHRQLGRKVANESVDRLWAIGPHAEQVAEEAIGRGLPAECVAFHGDVVEAMESPAFRPLPGDVWLFKGSRGMALERLADHVRGEAAELAAESDLSPTARRDRRRS